MSGSNKNLGQNSSTIEVRKWKNIMDMMDNLPINKTIGDNLIIAYNKINSKAYKNVIAMVSGGSDSDNIVDIIWRCDLSDKTEYLYFDTGLEYQATKDQLDLLENKYGIIIKRLRAVKSIPTTCKEYGVPFLSKYVSEFIWRLQSHGFEFEDEPYDVLVKKYPKCSSALKWWCNENGDNSVFNISRNKWLKEFLMENPPLFKIANKCCKYAKKDVFKKYLKAKENLCDLRVIGVRKSEGGARATAYNNCFSAHEGTFDDYRPIFWYKDADKVDYNAHFGVENSKCYTEYGLRRTGCCGCPFAQNFEQELEVIRVHEPKLYKAVNNIFGKSYEYTRQYKAFCLAKDAEYGSYASYMRQKK